jgi:hypothetical protein
VTAPEEVAKEATRRAYASGTVHDAANFVSWLAAVVRADRHERLLYLSGPPPVGAEREAVIRRSAAETVSAIVAAEGAAPPDWVWAYLRDALALLDHARAFAAWLERETGQQAAFDAGRAEGWQQARERVCKALETILAVRPESVTPAGWAFALGKIQMAAFEALKALPEAPPG